MSGSSSSRASGNGSSTAVGRGLTAIRSVLDEVRAPSGVRAGVRPERSDVRAAVLALLAEQPSDGYRIVRTLEERGAGDRTPSAGTVYPMLQLLADEGLATAAETEGRKTWTLTAAGRAAAESAPVVSVQRDETSTAAPHHRVAIVRSGAQLAQAVALAAQASTPAQVAEVVAVLDDARRRILSILSRS
jgi:DNA-binding PadR family transcriptional regulator